MRYEQSKIDNLVERLQVLEKSEIKVDELEEELNMFGFNKHDKTFQMSANDFLERFNDFDVVNRQCDSYPYQLVTTVGEYKIIALLNSGKHYKLMREGIIPEVEELAEIR